MSIHAPEHLADPYTGSCVICGRRPCVRREDFCADCIENGEEDDNFGRCYVCRDYHDHKHCIGVPCQCPCPLPDQLKRQQEIEQVLQKLSPAERQVLGF